MFDSEPGGVKCSLFGALRASAACRTRTLRCQVRCLLSLCNIREPGMPSLLQMSVLIEVTEVCTHLHAAGKSAADHDVANIPSHSHRSRSSCSLT